MKERIQSQSGTFEKRFNVAKTLLYMFYGHSITTSLNDYIIESFNRIAIDSSPAKLYYFSGVRHYLTSLCGVMNIFVCFIMIRCLYLDKYINKQIWSNIWSFLFGVMMFYKIDFGYRSFVNLSRENPPTFLDLKYCDDHFAMRNIKLAKLIFVSIFEILALISFLVIKAYLASNYWTNKHFFKDRDYEPNKQMETTNRKIISQTTQTDGVDETRCNGTGPVKK